MKNNELKKLKKQLDKLLKKDQTFIIKLIDKMYLVRGQELTEIDIIPDDLKVYEVAEKVGFKDSHYFCICFKKQTGKTVKEYRC